MRVFCLSSLLFVIQWSIGASSAASTSWNELVTSVSGLHCANSQIEISFPCYQSLVNKYLLLTKTCHDYYKCEYCRPDFVNQYLNNSFSSLSSNGLLLSVDNLTYAFAGPLAWTFMPVETCNMKEIQYNHYENIVNTQMNITMDTATFIHPLNARVNPYSVTGCKTYEDMLIQAVDNQTSIKQDLKVGFMVGLNVLQSNTILDDCHDFINMKRIRESMFELLGLSVDSKNKTMVTFAELEKIMDKLNLTKNSLDDHNHDGHEHSALTSENAVNLTCASAEQLVHMVGGNEKEGMTWSQFESLSPVLVHYVISGECALVPVTTTIEVTTAQKYGYGTLAVFIVSSVSMLGALVIPIMGSRLYDAVITFFVSMAIGTLVGDAIMHLIPQILSDGDAHNHGGATKLIITCAAIYLLFMVESLLNAYDKHTQAQKKAKESMTTTAPVSSEMTVFSTTESSGSLYHADEVKVEGGKDNNAHGHSHGGPENSKLVAIVVLLCEAVHNFADGMAIGAGFSKSMNLGLTTSIAIFVHEVPHELGDFAVLISSGFSVKKALLFNALSALTCFIGLYVALAVAQETEVQKWIFSVTVGMFFYVALGNMVQSLRNSRTRLSPKILALSENAGILIGFIIMILLSLFEDQLIKES